MTSKAKKTKAVKGRNSSKPASSLKEKMQKASKVVKIDHLKWKKIGVPDNLDDYGGFYGLEEIDGVDVEVVDGKVNFLVKDEQIVHPESADENSENELEEFYGFDSPEESNTPHIASLQDEVSTEDSFRNTKVNGPSKLATNLTRENTNGDLQMNTFSRATELSIPDDSASNLPLWDFCNLSNFILNGLAHCNFDKPTLIQQKSIPAILEGKDVIGKASTGSGKTLAYGIPILEFYINRLSQSQSDERGKNSLAAPLAIIFTPTRELAHQVVDHLESVSKFSPLPKNSIINLTGGLSVQKQERLLSYGPGIIVATPGRFLEHLESDTKVCERLSKCQIVVMDEADRLLQDGHFEELERSLELMEKAQKGIKNKVFKKHQTLVFSATFSVDLFSKLDKRIKRKDVNESKSLVNNEVVLKLLHDKLKFRDPKPFLIDINPKDMMTREISEALIECGPTERDLYLYYFLVMYPGSTLIFANAIDSVKRLVPFLRNLNIPVYSIHSSMIQKQRLRAIDKFKDSIENNQVSVLIASDVAARGLDIPNIDHVIHYHLPKSSDVYIHRSGRTARAGKEGLSLIICSPQEASGPLKRLRNAIAHKSSSFKHSDHLDIRLLPIEVDILNQLSSRVVIASRLADSEISMTSTKKESSWVQQAAEDLGIDELSDIEQFEDDLIKKQRQRKEKKLIPKEEAKALRAELKSLLSERLRSNHRRSYITSGIQNLAHQMVSGNTHTNILGHEQKTALEVVQKKGANNKMRQKTHKVSKKPSKMNKK